jgi:hypothetical protein
MQFTTIDEIARSPIAEHDEGEEIAPGVVIERRVILRVGIAAALFGAFGCSTPGHDGGSKPLAGGDAIDVDEFVRRIRPEAIALVGSDRPDERAYLEAMSALLARMRPPNTWNPMQVDAGWTMDTTAYFPPVVVFQIAMRPGAVIHLHDHRHYNGILLATEGSTRVRTFDMVHDDGSLRDVVAGDIPARNTEFLLRRTSDVVLRPSTTSALSRDRDNVHHIEAGADGCRLIDVFTHFRADARSYEMHWDERPFDAARGLYKASWKDDNGAA